MGLPAARGGDTVAGTDTHVCLVPSPSGSTPTPLPGHVFSGRLGSNLSRDVTIDGRAAATVGSTARNSPAHTPLPPGTSFIRPPSNSGAVSRGSATVTVNGRAAARSGDRVRSCNDPVDLETSSVTSGSGTVSIG